MRIETQKRALIQFRQIGLISFIMVFLCACGYQLRGEINSSNALQGLEVPEQLPIYLRQQLQKATIIPTGASIDNPPKLIVLDYNEEKRLLSESLTAITDEYMLIKTIRYGVQFHGQHALGPAENTVQTVFQDNRQQANNKGNEESLLNRELETRLASMIIRNLERMIQQQDTSQSDSPPLRFQ